MTPKEQDAFRLIEGGLELLRIAIEQGDAHSELKVRVNDLIKNVQSIAWPDLTHGPDVHAVRPWPSAYRRRSWRSS